jgi:hypothetical protein
MRLRAINALDSAPNRNPYLLSSGGQRVPYKTHDSAELLQCTQTVPNAEVPDSRYWTTYDHFMIEREARALRREYVYRLIANGWQRLRERLTASSPVSFGGPHR